MNTLHSRVMGIINVTPDSFSDGGNYHSLENALAHAEALISAGADLLDVGGESTRPYAEPVSLHEELSRTIPVIQAIRSRHTIPISIDTTKADVARQALEAGADIINDISALRKDPKMVEVVQANDVPIIIMHMQGTPADMQDRPQYEDVIDEILAFFSERIEWMTSQGIAQQRIILDPGIGFGKTVEHNLSIIKHLDRFKSLGLQILLGHSRKSFIGKLTGLEENERDLPTAVISALAVHHQTDIIRVHDVAASRLAIQLAEAIQQAK